MGEREWAVAWEWERQVDERYSLQDISILQPLGHPMVSKVDKSQRNNYFRNYIYFFLCYKIHFPIL